MGLAPQCTKWCGPSSSSSSSSSDGEPQPPYVDCGCTCPAIPQGLTIAHPLEPMDPPPTVRCCECCDLFFRDQDYVFDRAESVTLEELTCRFIYVPVGEYTCDIPGSFPQNDTEYPASLSLFCNTQRVWLGGATFITGRVVGSPDGTAIYDSSPDGPPGNCFGPWVLPLNLALSSNPGCGIKQPVGQFYFSDFPPTVTVSAVMTLKPCKHRRPPVVPAEPVRLSVVLKLVWNQWCCATTMLTLANRQGEHSRAAKQSEVSARATTAPAATPTRRAAAIERQARWRKA